MTDQLSTLLARVEKAEGADRELDGELWVAFVWTRENTDPSFYELLDAGRWRDALCSVQADWPKRDWVPNYSASLDASPALCERVLPGAYCGPQQSRWGFGHPKDRVWSGYVTDYAAGMDVEEHEGQSKAPAHARRVAMLRALLAQAQHGATDRSMPSPGRNTEET